MSAMMMTNRNGDLLHVEQIPMLGIDQRIFQLRLNHFEAGGIIRMGDDLHLIDELFAEIEEPIDGRRGWPDFEVIEVVVGAVEDRAVLVGGPRRKLPRGRQPGQFGMAGPVGPQRLVQHGRRGTSSRRRVRAR